MSNKLQGNLNGNEALFNPYVNTLKVKNGLDMGASNITNVHLINGIDIKDLAGGYKENYCIYKQNSPTNNFPVFNNWADVKLHILESSGAIDIWLDNSLATPVLDTDINMENRATFIATSGSNQVTLKVNDGITIFNLSHLCGVILVGNFSIKSPLVYDLPNNLILMEKGSGLVFDANSTLPWLSIDNINPFIIALSLGSRLDNNGFTGNSIECKNNSLLVIAAFSAPLIANNIISGDITCNLYFQRDNSVNDTKQTGFLGSIIYNNNAYSIATIYNDSKYPFIGKSNVQDAIDYLKLIHTLQMDSSLLSIPNSVVTSATFSTTEENSNADVTYSAGVFTFNNYGTFIVCYSLEWDGDNTGVRKAWLLKNGTKVYGGGYLNAVGTAGATLPMNGSTTRFFTIGDTIELQVFQSTAGALNLNYVNISIVKISP